MHSRHDLVWLSQQGWDAARRCAAPDALDAFDRWQARGWPTVVRRHEAGLARDQICLGLALPPHPMTGVKQRIALQAPVTEVARATPALALGAVMSAAPPAWQAPIAALDLASRGLRVHVVGSLALQAITGQRYLRPDSDIDLLLFPASVAALRAGLATLSEAARSLPLDGEVVFPCGSAVAWKEWLATEESGARVLVKGIDSVRLATHASLLATLGAC
jgi:phosphoribosyl-dephospho-CoA transferase